MKSANRKNDLFKTVYISLFAALICLLTVALAIPTPIGGYANLGDAAVLAAAFLLDPCGALFAAALGSLLADIFTGYVIYAPASLFIKGLMALFACTIAKALRKYPLPSYLLSGIAAEAFMTLGYYLYEASVLGYGFLPALAGVPANLLQGAFGLAVSIPLTVILKKTALRIPKGVQNGSTGKD